VTARRRDSPPTYSSGKYKDFHDWVDDNDILMEAFPLEAMGDCKRVG
jgi:hypothetical protein